MMKMLLLSSPFLPSLLPLPPSPSPISAGSHSHPISSSSSSSSHNYNHHHHNSGRLVDQNMIILRNRIHQIKLMEEQPHPHPPTHWMLWEKQLFKDYVYHSIICHAMEHLQTFFLDTRPSLALATLLLLTLSLSTSTALLTYNFFLLAQSLLSSS